jgi:hypothetical protein
MELFLNLVWMLAAMVFVGLWLRLARRHGATPRVQAVALLMLIVILLPVISVTDDLQALQNPAELDCCARRHHAASCPHSIIPALAATPPPAFSELFIGFSHVAAPGCLPLPLVKIPALASIQNRPPPRLILL